MNTPENRRRSLATTWMWSLQAIGMALMIVGYTWSKDFSTSLSILPMICPLTLLYTGFSISLGSFIWYLWEKKQ